MSHGFFVCTLLRVGWAYEDQHLEFSPVPVFHVPSHRQARQRQRLMLRVRSQGTVGLEAGGY